MLFEEWYLKYVFSVNFLLNRKGKPEQSILWDNKVKSFLRKCCGYGTVLLNLWESIRSQILFKDIKTSHNMIFMSDYPVNICSFLGPFCCCSFTISISKAFIIKCHWWWPIKYCECSGWYPYQTYAFMSSVFPPFWCHRYLPWYRKEDSSERFVYWR